MRDSSNSYAASVTLQRSQELGKTLSQDRTTFTQHPPHVKLLRVLLDTLIYSSFYLNFIDEETKLIRLKQSIKTKQNTTSAAHLFVNLVFQSIDVAFLQKALCFLQLVLH